MANARRFFRYDVTLPVLFEPLESERSSLHTNRDDLFDSDEQKRLEEVNVQLMKLMSEKMTSQSSTFMLAYSLNHRIEYMAWLIEQLTRQQNPKEAHDFQFRMREDLKYRKFSLKEDSKIAGLIDEFNNHLGRHLFELIESIQNNFENKVFLFPRPVNPLFEPTNYVTNLEQLAKQGIVPAQVLSLLVEKLIIWEKVFSRLKIANRKISDPETWSEQTINLSAGGFSILTEQTFDKFAQMIVFMKLDDDILISQAKLLFCRPDAQSKLNRVAIEFSFLSMENANKITAFVQKKEIEDAMALGII